MNNTLTAKEWLEKEGIYRSVAQGIDIGIIVERGIINSELMERYANYRTKMLEEKFSKYWKEAEMKILELEGKLKFLENMPKDKNYTKLS